MIATEAKSSAPPCRSWIHRYWWGGVAALVVLACSCFVWALAYDPAPPVHRFRVLKSYPHDPQAFTQGLVHDGTQMFEGTGKYGQSTLRRVELETGRVLQSHALSDDLFGEGIVLWGDRIYQLTWQRGVCIVYDKSTFEEIKRFKYQGQGWGLTHDGKHLIMSDGTATLRFLDPETFQVVRRVLVQSQGRLLDKLNELEYVDGQILANVYYKDYIAQISPETGRVEGWIDLRGLLQRPRDAVLNGIAYDAVRKRLFVTGKNWPKLFEIQVTRR